MRLQDQVMELQRQLDAREQTIQHERRTCAEMRKDCAAATAERDSVRLQVNAVRAENFRLKVRLDAVLYALVLAQLEIRKGQRGKPIKDELFLAVGQEPPPGADTVEEMLQAGFEFVDGKWRKVS